MIAAKLSKFSKDVRGAVAVIFTLVAVLIIGAAGMAVDFVNASGVRASLQQALDGAVLAAAAAHVETETAAENMTSNWEMKYPSLDAQISQTWARGTTRWN
jgi:Flp pilus assembly protein TadG